MFEYHLQCSRVDASQASRLSGPVGSNLGGAIALWGCPRKVEPGADGIRTPRPSPRVCSRRGFRPTPIERGERGQAMIRDVDRGFPSRKS